MNHIHCMKSWDGEPSDGKAAGYDGPGWYFWEENLAYCHGPFATKDEAKQNCDRYAEKLSGTK